MSEPTLIEDLKSLVESWSTVRKDQLLIVDELKQVIAKHDKPEETSTEHPSE